MRLLAVALLLLPTGLTLAAEDRPVTLLWDALEHFEAAEADNEMDASVRPGAKAGGVARDSIFLHPLGEGRATLTFPQAELDLPADHLAFLLSHVGVSDGFPWGDPENEADGCRFYVTVDGEDILQAAVTESAWAPVAAGLGDRGSLSLTLATDAGPEGDTNYDWAMFGQPVVVALPEETLRQATPVAGPSGVLVAQAEGGQGKLLVEGLDDAGQQTGDPASLDVSASGTTFIRFDFSENLDCVAWQWRAEGLRVTDAWGGTWQPKLRLAHVGPTRGVTFPGEKLTLRVTVANEGPGTLMPEHGVFVRCAGQWLPLPRIASGDTGTVEAMQDASRAGGRELEALLGRPAGGLGGRSSEADPKFQQQLSEIVSGPLSATGTVTVWPRPGKLPRSRPTAARGLALGSRYLLVENPTCRYVIPNGEPSGALAYVWVGKRWELAGTIAPWVTVMLPDGATEVPQPWTWTAKPGRRGVELRGEAEHEGVVYLLEGTLPDDGVALDLTLTVEPRTSRDVAAIWGPAVRAGDRGPGADKGIAIFPGLEYLEGDERSSSTRDLAPPLHERWTPHRFKVTIPFMLTQTRTDGPILGVAWDPNQRWNGNDAQPAAAFASPDFLTGQDNHLMQLGLPSIPDGIPESARAAGEPLTIGPGSSLRLSQKIVAGHPQPDVTVALEWFDDLFGYPRPERPPRSFEDEMALSRHGFMHSAWDSELRKSLHYVGSGASNAPGFATLMLMDARAVAEGDAAVEVLDRVELIARKTMEEQGQKGLASGSACHIMGWEFPYHWGHLPGALQGMRDDAYGAVGSQEADGGWGFNPDERRSGLGERGTKVMGTCARNAYLIAKWVAVSGDPVAEDALRLALEHMERYTVPRGAQGWECPIMQPDVLASAYAVRAYVWSAMALGEDNWLDDARYWARTGLPFQYTWDDGERPGMRYASIPVFGSTFYSHTWIGLPVQWCGLVYAYGLQELMRFDDNDLWRTQAEGITVSAMHQQWPFGLDEKLTGTYPDSYGAWFTRRNGVHINPEDIVINLLALEGLDPGLRSVPVKAKGGLLHVTAAADVQVSGDPRKLTLDLDYLPREVAYLSIAPVALTDALRVSASGEPLTQADDLPPGSTGWAYNDALGILTVGAMTDEEGRLALELSGLERSVPETPQVRSSWSFDRGTEGWRANNACHIKADGGVLTMTTAGEDPYSAGGVADIDAEAAKLMRARVRLTAGGEVNLFWRSNLSPGWGPDKELAIPVPADGKWHEVTWDLSDHALWAGKVIQLRLDLEGDDVPPGAVLQVDWIKPAAN